MMKSIACTIDYGRTAIGYELLMVDRKSLEIAVHPDKSVVVKAPRAASFDAIEEKVRKRARWIKRQIAYFQQFDPRTPEREYVGGESHLYLGRKYRLKIEKAKRDSVVLKNGYFYIGCVNKKAPHVKGLLDAWYRQRAKTYIAKLYDDCWKGFNGKGGKPDLRLRQMKTRWGSLTSKRQLTLNTSLIQTPRECIEYVVVHELCHLVHRNHGPDFYKLLDRAMPDWPQRKHKLEMALA